MDRVGHTRTAALGPITACVEALGANPQAIFRRAGLPFQILQYPDLPLRLSDHYSVLNEAARLTGEECFGAVLGQQVQTLDLGGYGKRVMSAPTLASSIACAGQDLNGLMQTNTDLVLFPVGSRVCWSMIFHTPGHAGRYQNELLAVSYLLSSLRGYLGARWRPALIRLVGQDRSRARRLERIFDAPALCGFEACGIEFDPFLLATPRAEAFPTTPAPAPSSMPDGPASLASIRAAALIEVLSGTPDAASIASRLGLSLRSLQRRLADHGTSLSALVATLQYGRALALLAEGRSSIGIIADELGYSDPAHFTRAFHAWAGMAPSTYRARLSGRDASPSIRLPAAPDPAAAAALFQPSP